MKDNENGLFHNCEVCGEMTDKEFCKGCLEYKAEKELFDKYRKRKAYFGPIF
jgi:recombinational DNA repair protein RecR